MQPPPLLFLYLQSPHKCCMKCYLHPSHLCLPPLVLSAPSLSSLPSRAAGHVGPPSSPPLPLLSSLYCPFIFPCCPTSSQRGHGAALSQIAGGSGFLIILLTVHLSDKTEERERPAASLSFNGQPRNEGEAIKAGAEPESRFNVSDRPDRIINQELKEFKTFALGFLT